MLARLTEQLTRSGQRVATLKHHGHLEAGSLADPTTDTGKHWESGAMTTMLASPTVTMIAHDVEPPLSACLAYYEHIPGLQVLLVEGYKAAHYSKAVLVRDYSDWGALKSLENIKLVIAGDDVNKIIIEAAVPVFEWNAHDRYIPFIMRLLEEQNG